MIDKYSFHRGQIVKVDFGVGKGSEQSLVRPAVIVSNNAHNKYSNTLVVVPLTSKCKDFKRTHFSIHRNNNNLTGYSYALVEQIRCISAERVTDSFLGDLTYDELRTLDRYIAYELDL